MNETERPVTLQNYFRLCAVIFLVVACTTGAMIATSFSHIGDGWTLKVALILAIAVVLGRPLLNKLGVTVPALQTAGGIILLIIALDMVFARPSSAFRLTPPEGQEAHTKDDLAVISDEGAVYLNDHAWIMVLYAMVEYRDWAARLTHPLLMPLARQAFAALSKNRHTLSRWIGSEDTEGLAGELRKVELEPCALPAGNPPASSVRDYLQ